MASSNTRNAVGAVVIICIVYGIYMVHSPQSISQVTSETIESELYTEEYNDKDVQTDKKGNHQEIVDKAKTAGRTNKVLPKSDNQLDEKSQEESESGAADVAVSAVSSSTTITLPAIVLQSTEEPKNSSQEVMTYDQATTEEPVPNLINFIMDFEKSEDIAEVLAARRAHVYETCQLHKTEIKDSIAMERKAYLDLKSNNRNVITDHRQGLTFCTVAKSGSTFWKSVFIFMNTGAVRNGMSVPQHLNENSRRSLNSWRNVKTQESDYTSFVAVRNPWKRLVSLYQQKIENFLPKLRANNFTSTRGMLAYRYILKVCHAEPRQLVTFADMLKCVLAHDRNHRPNRHWETAYEYCDICNVNYSYIIRTENMMEEGAYVMDQAGLDNSKRILNVVRGGTIREVEKRKPRPHSDYYKDIDIEIINRLQGIYEWELKLFNYPHTPFTN